MFGAPVAHCVRKRGGEQLRYIIVIAVAVYRNAALRFFPEQLRQHVQKVVTVGCFEALGHAVRPGDRHVGTGLRFAHREALLARELRLVREDGGYGFIEFIAHLRIIALVRHFDEPADGVGVQRVGVGLAVVPARGLMDLQQRVPFFSRGGIVFANAAVAFQQTVGVQTDVVAGDEPSLAAASAFGAGIVGGVLLRFVGVREQQAARAVFFVLRHKTARRAGGPAVLVVKPRQHFFRLRFVNARFHQLHEVVVQIGVLEARAHVHMKAAEAHLFEYLDLAAELFLR